MRPSGAGKSTICNALQNQDVELPSLEKPAKVSRSASGVTDEITNYWCDNALVVTDTIGIDDQRFTPEKIVEELKRMLKTPNLNVLRRQK